MIMDVAVTPYVLLDDRFKIEPIFQTIIASMYILRLHLMFENIWFLHRILSAIFLKHHSIAFCLEFICTEERLHPILLHNPSFSSIMMYMRSLNGFTHISFIFVRTKSIGMFRFVDLRTMITT